MREIKFRAWDTILEKMLTMKEIEQAGMNLYALCEGVKIVNLMQYTGSKDKNGKEVYEGDVIDVKDEGFPFVENWIGVVKFIQGSYLIENLEGTDGEYLFDEIREIEVIGNIFENPELLK